MSASPKFRFGFAAAGLSCLFAGYVVAQQETVRDREDATIEQPADDSAGQSDRTTTARRDLATDARGNRATTGARNPDVQRYVASCLHSKNQAEVEMGKLAQQQAETPEVKEFAQKMVQDHGKFVQLLQPLAGAQTGARTDERTRPAGNREATGQNAAELNAKTDNAGDSSAIDQLLAMERQIADRCKEMAREELQQKQGVEFDKAYIGSQIGGHMHMLAALEVIQQQGPQELQQIAQQAHPVVQKHYDHAKMIMKQLDGAEAISPRAARQPASPQR